MSYSNGYQETIKIPGAVLTAAAPLLAGITGGGGNKTGRIAYIAADVTVAIDAPTTITFGTAATPDLYGSFELPIAAVGDQVGGDGGGVFTPAGGPSRIPGGVGAGVWEIGAGGEATTGTANLTVIVEWS